MGRDPGRESPLDRARRVDAPSGHGLGEAFQPRATERDAVEVARRQAPRRLTHDDFIGGGEVLQARRQRQRLTMRRELAGRTMALHLTHDDLARRDPDPRVQGPAMGDVELRDRLGECETGVDGAARVLAPRLPHTEVGETAVPRVASNHAPVLVDDARPALVEDVDRLLNVFRVEPRRQLRVIDEVVDEHAQRASFDDDLGRRHAALRAESAALGEFELAALASHRVGPVRALRGRTRGGPEANVAHRLDDVARPGCVQAHTLS